MHLIHRQTCRVCGSNKLTDAIDLGLQHLQGSFVKGDRLPPGRKIPCELVRCDPSQDENACGLLQMRHSVPPAILYSDYWYVSGTNKTMTDHLNGIVKEARILGGDEGHSPKDNSVLDIGCNDLTLLNCFPPSWTCVGIDPSNTIPNQGPGNITVVRDLFPSEQVTGVFDVITSIAMFYDLEDPVEFARSVGEHLAPDGTWIVEMSYMPSMLRNNSYDTICHEHLEYYSLSVLEWIMDHAGLKIYRAELNDSNGGSIRCYVTHKENDVFQRPEWASMIKDLRQHEFDLELDTYAPYYAFQNRISEHRDRLMKLLTDLKYKGNRIHLYGASTKGNTLLQYCNIDARLVECASDRNPKKDGAMTLGTAIPIVSEEKSRAMNPDYYLVLPWHFREEFIARERAAYAGKEKKPKFIFPLPEVQVVEL